MKATAARNAKGALCPPLLSCFLLSHILLFHLSPSCSPLSFLPTPFLLSSPPQSSLYAAIPLFIFLYHSSLFLFLIINNIYLYQGDIIRKEDAPFKTIIEVKKLIEQNSRKKNCNVILYQLDKKNISSYSIDEFKQIYK